VFHETSACRERNAQTPARWLMMLASSTADMQWDQMALVKAHESKILSYAKF
jgi:hypothetical protein